jgi:hypothetical protein
MKSHSLKVRKGAARRAKKSSLSESAAMRRKVKQTFAEQVDAVIDRYRPVLQPSPNGEES